MWPPLATVKLILNGVCAVRTTHSKQEGTSHMNDYLFS